MPESIHVNGALARARLVALTGDTLEDLRGDAVLADDEPGGAESRSRDIGVRRRGPGRDRSLGLSVLDGALGAAIGRDRLPRSPPWSTVVLDALIPERIALQPALEREAYGALEWADWLGVVIEAVRRAPAPRSTPRPWSTP